MIESVGPAGLVRHPPVLSGDYRDLKYAKTGFITTNVPRGG
jgi:hypothetical protein